MTPPSSRPPAGIPSAGNNTKYAVAVVALFLAIGAVVLWRKSSAPPPVAPPAPAPVAQTAAPVNPKMEDIPAPPPVEEKPEPTGGPRVIYVPAAAPCEAKCTGTPPPELAQALQVRGMQARRCYNEALTRDPSLRGRLVLDVRISTGGNVCAVNVTTNEMHATKVADCAAHILGAGAYPAPRGGCVDSVVPLSFVPQGQ